MNAVGAIGRIIFTIPFLMFGIMHLMAGDKMAGMVPIPGGAFWIYFTGVALLAGGLAIAINKLTMYAALGIALLMALFVFTLHLPGVMNAADEATRMMPMMGLLKDLGLMGGALVIATGAKK